MPEILDWQRIARPRAAQRFIVSALQQGGVVALPTESAYTLAVSGLVPDAVSRLRTLAGDQPFAVSVSGLSAARDWLPELGGAGQRLAKRFWPGPVAILSREGSADGVAGRLEASASEKVSTGSGLCLRNSAHDLFLAVTRRLPGPLLTAPVLFGSNVAVTAQQVCDSVGTQVDLVIDDGQSRYPGPLTVVEVQGDNWTVSRQGLVSAEEIREQLASVIVFVCTGNTCRSPLAEVLCKKRLADRLGCSVEELPQRGYRILSAGMAAMPGMPAAGEAVEVAHTLGADLTRHQSRPLTRDLIDAADHLFVMTQGHAMALEQHLADTGFRSVLLSPDGDDVADPIGQSQEIYRACAEQMDRYIQARLEHLLIR